MKKRHFLLSAALLTATCVSPAATPGGTVYVDDKGVMRRSGTDAEVSYYGTNYTVPFAHAYRALGALGVDRKQAVDRDVYHMARLGFNGFRLHLWDVELSDAQGNLLQNDHLDLLDYLIWRLESRGIDIVLTAQTNFGNGYPEKDTDTGAFSYRFPKCGIHEDRRARKAQANYLEQLARHVNPYTGKSYAGDDGIIAIEINNEPCHTGTGKEVTAYIDRMAGALRKGGFGKPVLYNVSHNRDVTQAYYEADIQGTTYQWYPTGLVAGHERKGNFLPYVDDYTIPWKDSVKNYGRMARLVYEFDPGDILYSYMYPAIVRTLRREGFQWITQFAYDPTDMARFNTEYQTHFLNLAYTPSKAVGMLIAAEAARSIGRGEDFGRYPHNTDFGGFSVDGENDLALMDSGGKFYYTRSTSRRPTDIAGLRHIAGTGSSPVAEYGGTGAYFLDRLDDSVWRLEVMPDVVLTEDPFAKPSLKREVGAIVYAPHEMSVSLPSLGENFMAVSVTSDGEVLKAESGSITVMPGVYLLSKSGDTSGWTAESRFGPYGNMKVGEFAAPAPTASLSPRVSHTPRALAAPGDSLQVFLKAVSGGKIDAVRLYPSDVSFWKDDNTIYDLEPSETEAYVWECRVPVPDWADEFSYNIVAYSDGRPVTFPAAYSGTPLDWDYPDHQPVYTVKVQKPSQPVVLMQPVRDSSTAEAGSIPDGQGVWLRYAAGAPMAADAYRLEFTPSQDNVTAVVRNYVAPVLSSAPGLDGKKELALMLDNTEGIETVEIGLTDRAGITRSARVSLSDAAQTSEGRLLSVPLGSLVLSPTLLIPAAFPSFMPRYFEAGSIAGDSPLSQIEFVTVSFPGLRKDCAVKADIRALVLR